MIKVLYISNNHPWSGSQTDRLLSSLPGEMQKKIMAYKGWQEQQSRILGKWLLMRMLERYGIGAGLDALRYTEYNKPYIPSTTYEATGGQDFDFSIAHSGSMVVCAGVLGARIGVDIERTLPIDPDEQREQFSTAEWHYIHRAPDPLVAFYELWTRKEALLKACGRGVDLDMSGLDVLSDTRSQDGTIYTIYPLRIAEGYSGHVATSAPSDSVSVSSERLSGPL